MVCKVRGLIVSPLEPPVHYGRRMKYKINERRRSPIPHDHMESRLETSLSNLTSLFLEESLVVYAMMLGRPPLPMVNWLGFSQLHSRCQSSRRLDVQLHSPGDRPDPRSPSSAIEPDDWFARTQNLQRASSRNHPIGTYPYWHGLQTAHATR